MATKKQNSENNVDTDFDSVPSEDSMRQYMENYNRNEVRIAGTVRDIFVTEPKMKMKKALVDGVEKKIPALDDDGNEQFYESSAYVTVSFDGGEMQLNLKKSIYEPLVIGRRYMFEGTKGMNYGSVQDKFHSVIAL